MVTEEVILTLSELSQDKVQQLEDMWQVLLVGVELAADFNELANCLLLDQMWEEVGILSELLQD